MIRRICIYGGPGSGKSTLAADIFAELKKLSKNVEHISEYVKSWAYEGRKPVSYDQLYIFAKQLRAEDVILRHVPLIVTDSPLLMNNAYSEFYGCSFSKELIALSQSFDREFPPLNLIIHRTVDYVETGRYQTFEEAKKFDQHLLDFFQKNVTGLKYQINATHKDYIMDIILSNLEIY